MTVNRSQFVVDEITIAGSRCGPFAPALRLLESAQVDPSIMIADQFLLVNALEAMAAVQKPGMLKVLLKPSILLHPARILEK